MHAARPQPRLPPQGHPPLPACRPACRPASLPDLPAPCCPPPLRCRRQAGLLLLVHGEVTDPEVDFFDREKVFIETKLKPLLDEVRSARCGVCVLCGLGCISCRVCVVWGVCGGVGGVGDV